MNGLLAEGDRLLRGDVADTETAARRSLQLLLISIVLGGMLYGGVMGSFGGVSPERVWQLLYSAVKVPLLLLATFLVSVPSFFVFNSLLGLRDDFWRAVRALLATQAALAILLAALAPYTALWYRTSGSYRQATAFNGLMFAVATFSAQFVAWRHYRVLVANNPRHRWLFWTWIALYVFVGIQMAWVLRPFIGDPGMPPQWFREDAWDGNAYVRVARLVWKVFSE